MFVYWRVHKARPHQTTCCETASTGFPSRSPSSSSCFLTDKRQFTYIEFFYFKKKIHLICWNSGNTRLLISWWLLIPRLHLDKRIKARRVVPVFAAHWCGSWSFSKWTGRFLLQRFRGSEPSWERMVPVHVGLLFKNLRVIVTAHLPTCWNWRCRMISVHPSWIPRFFFVSIWLCLRVSNCTGKRSFSHLKRIKSALRSTQTQERRRYLHCESKKLCHFCFYCNFGKCWSIFKILSMSESERNGS